MSSIAFLFPHPADGPTGGYQVVYEYANRLAADGWRVEVVYSGSIYWSRKSLWHKVTNVVRQLQWHMHGYSSRRWFPIAPRVHERLSLSLCQRHVPVCDVYVATSPYTAYYLNQYTGRAAKMFYFIQGYEDWGPGLKAILEDTYHYPLRKIVIAHWLQEMLKKQYNETSVLITNGFDFHKYRLTIPIREKDPMRITMLYHTMELKDCSLGFRALEIVKQQYPELQVDLIGAPIAPVNLPSWYTYHHHPGAEEHNLVNNQAAIYIGTSRTEGWGLTVGEAMICGQAVCCTDNAGYSEMAEDGVTALMSPVGDAEQMAKNIKRLIADPDLRLRIAQRGHDAIQRFTWNSSYQKFKRLISE